LQVLGICFFSAARGKTIVEFNKAMASVFSSLMIITAVVLILPTTLYSTFKSLNPSETEVKMLTFSRASSVALLVLYVVYLCFQLYTHKPLFANDISDKASTIQRTDSIVQSTAEEPESRSVSEELPPGPWACGVLLLLFAIGIMSSSHLLLDSVNEVSRTTPLTKRFIAAILIPVGSNAPELMAIMAAARNGRTSYAIGVVVNSILQISLFLIPLLVVLGWAMDRQMTLYFELFQTMLLFFAVLVVNRLLQEGDYTYLQGLVLVEL
jgi:Ca2+:H+ antiporter